MSTQIRTSETSTAAYWDSEEKLWEAIKGHLFAQARSMAKLPEIEHSPRLRVNFVNLEQNIGKECLSWITSLKPEETLHRLEQWVRPRKEILFVSRGCIDRIEGNHVYCTMYRNEFCEDPQLVEFERDDFPEGALDEGSWFIYKQYRKKTRQQVEFSSVIELLPEEPYSMDEALAEYEALMKQLPDEF